MAENEQKTLISQIEAKRANKRQEAESERKKSESVELAKQSIPQLKTTLAELIRQHLPSPETEEVDYIELRRRLDQEREDRFGTNLKATIPSDEGGIEVWISSTSYPSDEGEKNENIDYRISVADLDHTLETFGTEATLISTQTSIPRRNGPMRIGGPAIKSYPTWKRPVSMEDLNDYGYILDIIVTSPDVEFSGTTKPITQYVRSDKV